MRYLPRTCLNHPPAPILVSKSIHPEQLPEVSILKRSGRRKMEGEKVSSEVVFPHGCQGLGVLGSVATASTERSEINLPLSA